MIETCEELAKDCAKELSHYEANVDEQWVSDITEEIMWWWMWTVKLRAEGRLNVWNTFVDRPFEFEDYVSQFENLKRVHILNIGSGPRSTMGEASALDSLEFTHMDPLASAYNAMMVLLKAPATGNIVFGAVEILSKLNLPKYHFIAAKNCLDHAYDVPKGLDQIVGQLSSKGVITLQHYKNEGEAQNYLGLHKWNIEIKDERIHIWNLNKSVFFDHEAHDLDLEYSEVDTVKGSGAPHEQINIILKRGL